MKTVIVLLGLVALAHLFRYEPISQNDQVSIVWDRWLQRSCYSLMEGHKIACSNEAVMKLAGEIQSARQVH